MKSKLKNLLFPNFLTVDQERDAELDLYRFYCVVAIVTTLIVAPFVYRFETLKVYLVIQTLFVVSTFSILLYLSFKNTWIKKKMDDIMLIIYILITMSTLVNTYNHHFLPQFSLGFIISMFVFSMVIRKRNHYFIYTVISFISSFALIILSTISEEDKAFVVSFLLIYFIVSTIAILRSLNSIQKINESRQFLKTLFNQSHDAYFIISLPDNSILDCNEIAVQLFDGTKKSDFHGKQLESFIKSKDEKNPTRLSYRTFIGKEIFIEQAESELEFDKKRYKTTRITDISNRKFAEDSYRELFEKTTDLLYIQNERGEFLDVNEAVLKKYEIKKDDIIGKTPEILSAPGKNDMEMVLKRMKSAWHGNTEKIDWWSKTKTGKIFPKELILKKIDYFGKEAILASGRDITERHQAAEEIKKSEEKFRSLFENNVAGVFKTKADGTIIDCNESFAKIFGYTKNELTNLSSEAFYFTKEERQEYLKLLESNERLINHERRFKSKSGNPVYALANVVATKNENGKVEFIEGTLVDHTIERENKEKLVESESLFKGLATNAPVLIMTATADGTMLYSNQVTPEHEAYSRVIGQKLFQFLHADYVAIYKEKMEECIREKTVVSFELQGMKAGKQMGWYFTKLAPIASQKQGEKDRIIIITTDITERKQVEIELKESEERLKLLSESSMEGVVFSKDGIIIDTNNQFVKIHGYLNSSEIVGKKISDFVHPDDLLALAEYMKKPKHEVNFRTRSRTKRGEYIFVESQGADIPYQGEKIRVSVVRDVTERVNYENELKNSRERYKKLIQDLPDGILIVFEGKVLFHNQAAERILALSEKELFDSDVKALLPDGINLEHPEKNVPSEYRLERKNQDPITVEIKVNQVVYNDKNCQQILLQDVTEKAKLQIEKIRADIAEKTNARLVKVIEEREEAERKLRDTQKLTKRIINDSLDIICAADKNGLVTEFNPAAERAFGYKAEEVLGRDSTILYKAQYNKTDVFETLQEKGVYSGEIINIRKDKSEFLSYLSASVLKDEEGDVVGFMGISRDITEMKKAELQLIESEEKYRDLFENATDLIQSVDVSGSVIFVNNAWKKTLGYTKDSEIVGKPIFNFIHPDSLDHCKHTLNEIMRGKQTGQLEVEFITKKGQKVIAEGTVTVKRDEFKNPIATRSIFRDTTLSKLADQTLSLSEKKYRAIYDEAYVAICLVDMRGKFIQANNQFCEIFQYQKQELNPLNFLDLVPAKGIRIVLQQHKRFLQGEIERHSSIDRFISKFGDLVEARITISLIKTGDKSTDYFVIVFDDITELKTVERQLKKSLHEKEVLLKEVHHRVKNNLQVISSILNLQSSYIKDPGTLQLLKESQNRIKSMSFIHESLYQNKDFSSINFDTYIKNLSANLFYTYRQNNENIKLNTNVEPDIHLNLDQAIPCGLIINELLTNSLKYAFTPKKGGIIGVDFTKKGKQITLSVKDNGRGLPDNFKIEEQDSLGLQLVHTLTEQLDGKLTVESKKGAKFTIKFTEA